MPQKKIQVTSPSGRQYEVDWNKDTEPTQYDFSDLQKMIMAKEEEIAKASIPQPSHQVTTAPPKQEKGLWDKILSPIPTLAKQMEADAETFTNPGFQKWLREKPIIGPALANTMAFTAGAIGGTDQFGSTGGAGQASGLGFGGAKTLMSPASLALTGTGLGELGAEAGAFGRLSPAIWNLASRGTRLASIPMALGGAQNVVQGVSKGEPGTAMQGLVQAVLGGLGLQNRGTAIGMTRPPVEGGIPPETPPMVGPKLLTQGGGESFINPQASIGPRFIAGQAGIADRTVPYIHDSADVMKAGPRSIQGAILNPDESLTAQPTVLPSEINPLADVGPFVAARGEVPAVPFGGTRSSEMPITSWGREIGGLGGRQEIVSSGEYKGPKINPETGQEFPAFSRAEDKSVIGYVDKKSNSLVEKPTSDKYETHAYAFGNRIFNDMIYGDTRYRVMSDKSKGIPERSVIWNSEPSPDAYFKVADKYPELNHYTLGFGRSGVVYKPVKAPPPTEAPAFAKIGEDTYQSKLDDRTIDVLAAAHADKAPRELIQNAWDAIKPTGGHIESSLSQDSMTLTMNDNGPGLTKDELGTIFVDPGATGKEGVAGTSGEFGVGKTSYLYSGNVDVVSRVRDAQGQLHEYYFSTTPQSIRQAFKIDERIPTGSDTGLKITYHSRKPLKSFDIYQEFRDLYGSKGTVNFKDNSTYWSLRNHNIAEEYKDFKKLDFDTPTTRVQVAYDPKSRRPGQGTLYGEIKVNGMSHRRVNFKMEGYNVPSKVVIDLDPKFPATDERYPFNIDRTQLNPEVEKAIADVVRDNILKPGQEAEIAHLRKAWADTTPLKLDNGTEVYILDELGHLSPESRQLVETSPAFKQMGTALSDLTGHIFDLIRQNANDLIIPSVVDIPKNFSRVGFTFTPTAESRWGVNFPNPDSPKSYASYIDLPWSLKSSRTPNQFVVGIFNTLKHELAHNVDRTEGGSHVNVMDELTRLTADSLPEIIDGLRKGFLDANGQPHAELSQLLQQVDTDSRSPGRPEFTLAGTGVYSKGQNGRGIPSENGGNSGGSRENAIRELQTTIAQSIDLIRQQKELYSKERSARLGAFMNTKGSGFAGYKRRMGTLKGELPKVEPPKFNITGRQLGQLLDMSQADPNTYGYEKVQIQTALVKMFEGGGLLIPSEIKSMGKTFGPLTQQMLETLKKESDEAGFVDVSKTKEVAKELLGLPRALVVTGDLSLTFRQGAGLAHTKEFLKAWNELRGAVGSEEFYRANEEAIKSHPEYLPWTKMAGLKLTDFENAASREENIPVGMNVAEKLDPTSTLFGKNEGLIRKSNRGNNLFINKLRWDVARRLYGELGGKIDLASKKPFSDAELASNVANYVNNATGRGSSSYKALESAMPLLNDFLFAPRYQLATAKFLNPATYLGGDPRLRQEYWKSLFSKAGVWMIMSGLAAFFGKSTGFSIETDPHSSDFMKVRIGNVRFDATMGTAKYITLITRELPKFLGGGYTKSLDTGELRELGKTPVSSTRLSLLGNFAVNIAAPIPRFIVNMFLKDKDFNNMPPNLKTEIYNNLTPMVIQDFIDIGHENPTLFPLVIMGMLGAGLQVYQNKQQQEQEPPLQGWK